MKYILLLSFFISFNSFYAQINGYPDTSFGEDGFVFLNRDDVDFSNDFVILSNNQILSVGGDTYNSYSNKATVVKFLESGLVDISFGTNGWVDFELEGIKCTFNTILLLDNGKFLCGGFAGEAALLVKYNANGDLDTSFGENGYITYSSLSNILDVEISQNNTLLLLTYSNSSFIYKKIYSDGVIDESFGNNGDVIANSPQKSFDTEGNLYLIDFTPNSFTITKYDGNGVLDINFADQGHLVVAEEHYLVRISVIIDETINVLTASYYGLTMHQYLLNGTIDNTFSEVDGVSVPFPSEAWGGFEKYFKHFKQDNGYLITFDIYQEYHSNILFYKIDENFEYDTGFGGYYEEWLEIDYVTLVLDNYSDEDSWFSSVYKNHKVLLDNQNRILLGRTYYPSSPLDCDISFVRLNNSNLSVEDYGINDSDILIFPNPTSAYFQIDAKEIIHKIEFFSFDNKLVKTIFNPDPKIDVSDISPGVYFIRMYTNSRIVNKKLVIK